MQLLQATEHAQAVCSWGSDPIEICQPGNFIVTRAASAFRMQRLF